MFSLKIWILYQTHVLLKNVSLRLVKYVLSKQVNGLFPLFSRRVGGRPIKRSLLWHAKMERTWEHESNLTWSRFIKSKLFPCVLYKVCKLNAISLPLVKRIYIDKSGTLHWIALEDPQLLNKKFQKVFHYSAKI